MLFRLDAFDRNAGSALEVSNADTDGFVVVDAVHVLPARKPSRRSSSGLGVRSSGR